MKLSWSRPLVAALFVLIAIAVLAQPSTPSPTPPAETTPEPEMTAEAPSPIAYYALEVLASYPHDPTAWTQGLLLGPDGTFYESVGLEGQSDLRQVDIATGEVLRQRDLSPEHFGEGLAQVGDRLIQLTWKNGIAYVWDAESFALLERFRYEGEGWGLCYAETEGVLVMSDGSSNLFLRDPDTFALTGIIPVTEAGMPQHNLNELECVAEADGSTSVYANIWYSEEIVRINLASGAITAVVDARGLLTDEERAEVGRDGVLNGIAYSPKAEVFYLTGKWWPRLFEVRFVPDAISE
jgi:glutamine cyclotransferase